MVINSYSFLKKIIGRNAYNEIKEYARKIIPIATCILVALWGLSFIFHWGVISCLLNITTGISLIFVGRQIISLSTLSSVLMAVCLLAYTYLV